MRVSLGLIASAFLVQTIYASSASAEFGSFAAAEYSNSHSASASYSDAEYAAASVSAELEFEGESLDKRGVFDFFKNMFVDEESSSYESSASASYEAESSSADLEKRFFKNMMFADIDEEVSYSAASADLSYSSASFDEASYAAASASSEDHASLDKRGVFEFFKHIFVDEESSSYEASSSADFSADSFDYSAGSYDYSADPAEFSAASVTADFVPVYLRAKREEASSETPNLLSTLLSVLGNDILSESESASSSEASHKMWMKRDEEIENSVVSEVSVFIDGSLITVTLESTENEGYESSLAPENNFWDSLE